MTGSDQDKLFQDISSAEGMSLNKILSSDPIQQILSFLPLMSRELGLVNKECNVLSIRNQQTRHREITQYLDKLMIIPYNSKINKTSEVPTLGI